MCKNLKMCFLIDRNPVCDHFGSLSHPSHVGLDLGFINHCWEWLHKWHQDNNSRCGIINPRNRIHWHLETLLGWQSANQRSRMRDIKCYEKTVWRHNVWINEQTATDAGIPNKWGRVSAISLYIELIIATSICVAAVWLWLLTPCLIVAQPWGRCCPWPPWSRSPWQSPPQTPPCSPLVTISQVFHTSIDLYFMNSVTFFCVKRLDIYLKLR